LLADVAAYTLTCDILKVRKEFLHAVCRLKKAQQTRSKRMSQTKQMYASEDSVKSLLVKYDPYHVYPLSPVIANGDLQGLFSACDALWSFDSRSPY